MMETRRNRLLTSTAETDLVLVIDVLRLAIFDFGKGVKILRVVYRLLLRELALGGQRK